MNSQNKSYSEGQKQPIGFMNPFQKLLKEHNPKLDEVMQSLKRTYPYSLELTGVSEDRRMELIEHLERMKTMDSRSLMLVQKQDELEHLDISQKELRIAKSLLPTSEELGSFWKDVSSIDRVKVVVADGRICL